MKHLWLIITLFSVSTTTLSQNSSFPTRSYNDLERLKYKLPYIRYYCRDSLLVYGSNHTFDSTDNQIRELFSFVRSFNPDLILYEGDGIGLEPTRNQNIRYYGEMGFLRFLADSLHITSLNIEPVSEKKYQELLKYYNTDQVLIATLGLQITYLKRMNEGLEKMFPVMIKDLQKEGLVLSDEQQRYSYFLKLYRENFHHEFSLDTFDERDIQAKYNRTVFNAINQRANTFRDQHILNLIAKQRRNKKLLLVLGGWHAIVCEPGFEELCRQ